MRRWLLLTSSLFIILFISACLPARHVQSNTSGKYIPLTHYIKPVAYTPSSKTSILQDALPAKQSSVWDRLRRNFQLNVNTNQAEVQRYIHYYKTHAKQLSNTLKRSEPFIYLIAHKLEQRGLPGELALLPIIESAYKTEAHSRTNAIGLWQIMPATGKHLGLKTDYFYNGRKDVDAATDAALNYLEYLNHFFKGDWQLSLAGYNFGEGNVRKAVRRNKRLQRPTDFWHLRLPKETKNYVPSFLALAAIFADPARYGIELYYIPNKPYVASVPVQKHINLAQAAQLANMPLASLHKLNPAINRATKHPTHDYNLLVPVAQATLFKKKLKTAPTYTMLAQNTSTTVTATTLPADTHIEKTRSTSTVRTKNKSKKTIHVVHRGESLWTISRKYGVSSHKISTWNAISKNKRNYIYPGQKLIIWTSV